MNTPSLGSKAPNFQLPDQAGQLHQLRDYQGKWLLLYFYPKDNTPGCTTEACELRDVWAEFAKYDAAVLGVSADSAESHAKFANKFNLPFPLLSDEGKATIKAYGVLAEKSMFGKKFLGIKRSSFLIDSQGKIAKIYENVKPATHAKEVLADLARLTS
jgi:thioredoxin-dependent peroxiredoxin